MKETNKIFQEMKSELERRTGVSVNSGGDMALRLYAVAAEISSLWAQVEWTSRQSFPQTASGRWLEMHAAARGLTRTSGIAAEGIIRFETDMSRTQELLIPAGAVCMNAAGTEFLTTKGASIAAGELYCDVPAAARCAGIFGNVPAESLIFMAIAPVGVVRCFNPEPFSGGSDGESDESLRARVISSFLSLPNGSNAAYYRSVAMDMDGVAETCVVPRARGLGTVDVFIAGAAGLPSEGLIEAVWSKLQAQREIAVDVRVLAPDVVTVPVSVSIYVGEECDFDEVSGRVRLALREHFNGSLLGKDVLLARLGSVIFGIDGVLNYKFSSPAADLPIAFNELPVAGAISVTKW